LSGGDPQRFDAIADGVDREGQEVEGGEGHGEMLFAATEADSVNRGKIQLNPAI